MDGAERSGCGAEREEALSSSRRKAAMRWVAAEREWSPWWLRLEIFLIQEQHSIFGSVHNQSR